MVGETTATASHARHLGASSENNENEHQHNKEKKNLVSQSHPPVQVRNQVQGKSVGLRVAEGKGAQSKIPVD